MISVIVPRINITAKSPCMAPVRIDWETVCFRFLILNHLLRPLVAIVFWVGKKHLASSSVTIVPVEEKPASSQVVGFRQILYFGIYLPCRFGWSWLIDHVELSFT